jgi:long-chain fatty acid transport protein
MKCLPISLACATALLAPLGAHATNGYFSHGYGAKSQGIAGVGIALPQDALAAATNPAGTASVGNRLDLGATLFAPRRSADIEGNAFGPDASYSGDGRKLFLIPDFGYTRALSASTSVGLAVYGNGGMNTSYDTNPYGRFGATGKAGVNLEQLFISPSVAHKLDEVHTLGVALNVAYQRFDARGIGLFGGFSAAPAHVSDQGKDSDVGVGLRLGWTGQLTPQLRLGATWASKVQGRFDKYRGLFADGGGFDIPENLGAGIAYAASPATTLAADVQHIRYGDVASVGNSAARLFAGQPLGSANGPGFGWRNLTVLKLGVQHQVNEALTLRAGFSVANQPVPRSETFFNVLAPGVIRQHVTVGATWKLASGGELSGFYALGLGKTVRGAGSIPPGFPPAGLGGGNANVRLKEHILGVSYGWTF